MRSATSEDVAGLAVVEAASWRAAFVGLLPADYLAGLDTERLCVSWKEKLAGGNWPSSGTLLAEGAVDGEVRTVGYSRFYPTEDMDDDPRTVSTIGALYTLPEVWGTGIGKTLMARTLATMAEAGFRSASLWVLEDNLRARTFYQGQGWTHDGTVLRECSDGMPITKLRYRCALPTN
ncbi:GNAT family N-acetyltransferase [Streptomyces sp. NRRL S-350]|uniref:GNAT family N-acetyltransferase n=1 Tax=Streptomyces sp. NRRL S-350 TaxID=1463902 RepID=UPI00068A0A1A|nr:GNAT family N-acetyltransferase [Streptomyces sp. NRRL S-350]